MEINTSITLVLITLGVILVFVPSINSICHRFGLPASVGYIVFGLILGGIERPWISSSPEFISTFGILAQLGVVALLFRVGLRSHTSVLLDKLPSASVIWLINVFGSAAIGFLVSRYGFLWSLETSLAVGIAFSATSIVVSVSVWDELGKLGSDEGQILVDVAELDDLSAVVLLAVLLGILPTLLNGGNDLWYQLGNSSLKIVIKLTLFILGCYLFAHFIEAGFTKFNRRMSDTPASLTISILGAGLAIASVGSFLGFSIAIGALFAGLAFSRDPEAVRTDGNFTYFYNFFTPFFFIHIGIQTDLTAFIEVVDIGLILFIAAALSKFIFTVVPARFLMKGKDALTLGVSMIPRAEIALVVLYECRALDDRIISSEVFASIVMVSLITCIISPIILRQMLKNS